MAEASTATVNPETPVGDIVAADPAAARVFEALQIDFCCGGKSPLAEACESRGLDPATVMAMIAAADRLPTTVSDEHDLSNASIEEICEHIVASHHDRAREDLERIAALAEKVERAHGASDPRLHDVRARFTDLRHEMESHMDTEESVVFPACQQVSSGAGAELEPLLVAHEGEHAEIGAELVAIRDLADGYDENRAFCNTHRVLLHSLREFEADTHQHVHEENNVLFPLVREAAAA